MDWYDSHRCDCTAAQQLPLTRIVLILILAALVVVLYYSMDKAGLVVALVPVILVAATLLPPRFTRSTLIVALFLAILYTPLVLFCGPNPYYYGDQVRRAHFEHELHSIQMMLERYATDCGAGYPLEFEELHRQGYYLSLPINPYAEYRFEETYTSRGRRYRDRLTGELFTEDECRAAQRMRNLDVHYWDLLGNFRYQPHIELDDLGQPRCLSYRLTAYDVVQINPLSAGPSPYYRDDRILVELTSERATPVPSAEQP